jgi:hypothetical protein
VFADDDLPDLNDNRALLCWTGYHTEMEINARCGNGFGYGNQSCGNGFGDGGDFPGRHHYFWW